MQVDFAAWQYAFPNSTYSNASFGQIMTSIVVAPTILAWFAPYDFFKFPQLKISLKGSCFESFEYVQKNIVTVLKGLLGSYLYQYINS